MHKSIFKCQIIQFLLPEEASIICQKSEQICIATVRGPLLKPFLQCYSGIPPPHPVRTLPPVLKMYIKFLVHLCWKIDNKFCAEVSLSVLPPLFPNMHQRMGIQLLKAAVSETRAGGPRGCTRTFSLVLGSIFHKSFFLCKPAY